MQCREHTNAGLPCSVADQQGTATHGLHLGNRWGPEHVATARRRRCAQHNATTGLSLVRCTAMIIPAIIGGQKAGSIYKNASNIKSLTPLAHWRLP